MNTVEEIKKRLTFSLKREANSDNFISENFIRELASSSVKLHKDISVFLSRKKQIIDVTINGGIVTLSSRQDKNVLSKVFCINTKFGKDARISGIDLATLKNLKLDFLAILTILKDGRPGEMQVAFLSGERLDKFEFIGPYPYEYFLTFDFLGKISETEQDAKTDVYNTEPERERVVLVDVRNGKDKEFEDYLFDELERLTYTASGEVVYKLYQKKGSP
ncbi:MAG TPA: hypothetical protein P5310_08015, partial [bacterium]|nr:hypothetical protein [bacterium]